MADDRQLATARRVIAALREAIDLPFSLRLWDGSLEPLGRNVTEGLVVAIRHPGVVTSILRRPGLERILRHYASGMIDFEGGTLIDFGRPLVFMRSRAALKRLPKKLLFDFARAFFFAPPLPAGESRAYAGDETGTPKRRSKDDDRRFIEFHYDLSNAFYELFLDERMVYTCAYFTDWENSIDEAQRDKLEMICRKLRLKEGDRFLDIGCGWGALVCHAAEHFGVNARGVTLSTEQYEYARARVKRLGLEDRVTIELKDYTHLDETFDKISSIGMMEAIGIANTDVYFGTVRRLLADKGLFLNHAISRKAKKHQTRFSSRPEQRMLQKYIFPGGELDDLGHTIQAMERHGFEVMDVEGWRQHYERTTELWCRRLTANRDKAVAEVGEEAYRIWVAYLGGVSLAFTRGSARLYQTLVSKNPKGPTNLPPTRADLYR
ncbi:MAG: class I SAM-dependent methyltransferase [Hyphomicrobiales bacterium]